MFVSAQENLESRLEEKAVGKLAIMSVLQLEERGGHVGVSRRASVLRASVKR